MTRKYKTNLLVIALAFFCLRAAQMTQADTVETIVDGTSFDSWTALEAEWDYYYPWGSRTHNGSARMYIDQLSLADGVLTITAETPDPDSDWKYRSGCIHLKEDICINDQYSQWSFYGEFRAPYETGTWPAFWITHAGSWTHECDILEYKGDKYNWFNTYDGGWETKKVWVDTCLSQWHSYELVMTRKNDSDVATDFYLDGVLKATHTLSGGMGKCFWLIINLQMEGSSGSPGPTDPTYYYARNVIVTRTAVDVEGPPSAPTNLAATAGDGEISLSWDPSPEWDVDHYNVYSSTTSGGPHSLVATNVTAPSYVDTGLTNGTTYYYVVTAVDTDSNESTESNEASTTPDVGVDLLLRWALNEGDGSTAGDSSGNNNDGVISGPAWSSPGYDDALWCLSFDGNNDTVTDADAEDFLNGLNALTVSMWLKSNGTGTDRGVFDTEDPDSSDDTLGLRYDADGYSGGGTNLMKAAISTTGGSTNLESSSNVQTTEWQHLALTWSSGNSLALYIDGVQDTPSYNSGAVSGTVSNVTELLVGKCAKDSSSSWDGLIDELRIYNRVLSESAIAGLAGSDSTPASNPDPANDAPTVPIAAELTWTAGQGATAHDVYFGTADPPAFVTSQTACTYQPPLMNGTTTYYWRIDEINSGGTTTGDLWTFTTRIPGDVNADGSLNLADLQQFCDGWLLPEPEPDVDINGDGQVDFRDYAYLTESW